MEFIRTLKSGKSQIIKNKAFVSLLSSKLPPEGQHIQNLFETMDNRVKAVDNKITREALSNAHGDWYEWLLAISSWNVFATHKSADLALLLPNVSRFDLANLYKDEYAFLIEDLRQKVESLTQVHLITSNPDFVIVERELALQVIDDEVKPISELSVKTLDYLSSVYKKVEGVCEFDQVLGYISVKTSFRPDRRLQIPHEGSLMKAIYIHLQTRKWIINPPGLKYYAIATKVSDKDKNALKTVATHSITTVSSLPQAAVDDVFEVNSLQRAEAVFHSILC